MDYDFQNSGEPWNEEGFDDRYVKPAAVALKSHIQGLEEQTRCKAKSFHLRGPVGVLWCRFFEHEDVCIRGLAAYDLSQGKVMLKFDTMVELVRE